MLAAGEDAPPGGEGEVDEHRQRFARAEEGLARSGGVQTCLPQGPERQRRGRAGLGYATI